MPRVGSSPARVVRDADRRMLAGVAAALAQVALGVGLVGAGVAVFLVATPSVAVAHAPASWPPRPSPSAW